MQAAQQSRKGQTQEVDNMLVAVESEDVESRTTAVQTAPVSERRRRRGPRPSPAKMKRDAERADSHRAVRSFESHTSIASSSTDMQEVGVSDPLWQPLEPIAEARPNHARVDVSKRAPHSSKAPGATDLQEVRISNPSREPLEPIAEASVNHARVVDARKRAEKDRLRKHQAEERAAAAITCSTETIHAPGDALKAAALCLEVGSTRLLEDTKLIISEQTGIHGLVGPNGCGKTTLMRLIAGKYAPDFQLPTPRAWGTPYLVDQLDPEPTGRSPVEEVLSGCQERAALLEEHRMLSEKLATLDEQLDDGHELVDCQSLLEKLTEQISDVDEQLARWDCAEKEVTRILVGLGFHDGEQSAGGAPSLRVKDELVAGTVGLKMNGPVEVRDNPDEDWLRGIVTSIDPLMVQPNGFRESFIWTEVRHARELSGGWRKKVELAKALWMKPKLLLLDEPTNHLDFHALLWLEEELRAYPHTVVIVSHNACFLSEVCTKVLHIVDKKIQTLHMADLSLESLAAMQRSDERHCKFRDWRFAFPRGDEPEMHGLSFHDVSFAYSPEAPYVLRDLNRNIVRFNGRSRTVILGRNGSGKSTLLKLCLGVLQPTHGDVDVSCEMRHFSQHFNEALDRYPEYVATSYLVECCRPGLEKRFKHTCEERLLEDACEVLSWFGLGKNEATKTPIRDLSGGQKARLNFAFLNLCPAHLLILDEPTNHLDANGLEHLTDALRSFEGGVVLVSHDELLVRRVLQSADHSELLVCSGGSVEKQSGVQGLDGYRRDAFREQHLKAEAAAEAAEHRLRVSRQERKQRPRGQRRRSVSIDSKASTREPTPDGMPAVQQDEKEKKALEALKEHFKSKGKKKPKPMNLSVQKK